MFYFCTCSPPQPSCARPSSDSVCGKIISQNSKVYVHRGLDINTLEKRAHDSINQLKNDSGYCYNQMVKVICYSFLAPCYMDAAKPTSVCPESCQAIITAQCHSGTFNNVLVNLPEWSPSRNCLKSEAISNEECIHLSVPSVERKNFTDGEWIGLVVSALACSAYWLKLLYCGWPYMYHCLLNHFLWSWLHCKQDCRYIKIH